MVEDFHKLSLALFSGKGGVGKTTLACGLALHWASQFPDDRILLLSTDPAHSLGDVLQMQVDNTPNHVAASVDFVPLPNLSIRALDAHILLKDFKERYGDTLQLLVERGSFVEGEDLTPVWDLEWPGVDELMGLLEIQRLFDENLIDRVVVDMAPSGHALNLLGLMDFLDNLLESLELFQEKHRTIGSSFTGSHRQDEGDEFLDEMRDKLASGRARLQDADHTSCFCVAIPEPMSLFETRRFLESLQTLKIHLGGIWINHIVAETVDGDRYREQQPLMAEFIKIAAAQPIFLVPELDTEPLGVTALNSLFAQTKPLGNDDQLAIITQTENQPVSLVTFPDAPKLPDFLSLGRRLVIVGGKGGVGKTTVAAAIGWAMAERYSARHVRMVSIDPAHSLGDAFGCQLGHQALNITDNLSGQEIDADQVLDRFRSDYLWELAEMMGGDSGDPDANLKLAYGPEAWRRIVSQSLPGLDEMLSLVEVMELLESHEQDLIVLDTAPTGHLLRFLEIPTAMSDWLAWIFKLWIKYQNVLGRVEFMGRLRTLRQRVVKAQKRLADPEYTEFIGVVQNRSAILAEAERLVESVREQSIAQNYIVHNRAELGKAISGDRFGELAIVPLPNLPRCVEPIFRIQKAAELIF
ncbi:arsenic transporter [Limnospira fusiformis CCALA 023]|uniref:ArsA family ATPase n=1 Tax=Arthrospira sp. PCC 8006 TaxID=1982224 RepID=UPI00396ECB23